MLKSTIHFGLKFFKLYLGEWKLIPHNPEHRVAGNIVMAWILR